ncbi:hypothetical protein [Micromonospora sp. NPDC047134]|uniref:hypothetical protein n=1 Tax=Micromonospora sp. NPDC047134 TaxID=3154340 RepID=UPI0034017665
MPPTPTSVDRRSSANTSGPLLPTPRASDTGTPGRRAGAGFRPPLSQVLLPTPRATDGTKGCPGQRGSHGDLTLPSAAVRVPGRTLPTPRASDANGPGRHGDGGTDLRTTVADLPQNLGRLDEQSWGVYASAVARWELLLGRPVPQPTQAGTHGKPVLAPPFVEWLMGLSDGHVTAPQLGLPRTAALRVLGNGGPAAGHSRAPAAAVPAPLGVAGMRHRPPGGPSGSEYHRSGPVALYPGDAVQLLSAMPDASVDAVVPPSGQLQDAGSSSPGRRSTGPPCRSASRF